MANRARGETAIEVPGVGTVTLCLTMAGMAAIEDAFEVDSMPKAMEIMGKSNSTRHIATVIHALMLGSPDGDKFTVEQIRHWPITPAAIAQAMAAMNASNDDAGGNEPGPEPANRAMRRANKKP